ncbi:MAG: AraC family transcriptional regulator ligand-binding domain-containing protein [Pseudomonadota bacterium]
MGLISSLFVHKVIAAATAVEPPDSARRIQLFESVAVDPALPIDPKVMVDDTAYYALCERAVREDPEGSSLSLRVGGSMRCDDYGAFGLAWKTALTLRGSYARAERYGLVLTSVSTYDLRARDGRNFMTLHRSGERELGLRISNEQTIAAIAQISREVAQERFVPEEVWFIHDAPRDTSAHKAFFGCPVRFSMDRDALLVSDETLDAPNQLGDAGVSKFLEAHLNQELADLPANEALGQRVLNQIAESLSEGLPAINDVAKALGMSGRTLQRRLARDGHTFQQLVTTARRDLSRRLLRDSSYSLVEVAFLTGFSEQSAFNRAFKRWSGQTPRSFRLSAGAA